MHRSSLGAGVIGATVALVGVALLMAGAVDLRWPFGVDDLTSTEKAVVPLERPEIFHIEAVSLDCRARVHASVPVTGRKEHRLFGQVYRTDEVELVAVGDVDTCLDADAVQILERNDGSFDVLVPADAIRFERPRVDMTETRDSIRYGKGKLGKLTDAFPWVDDTEGLTGGALAYAQGVIGGSECMEAAYSVTRDLIEEAYRDQLTRSGRDAEDVRVVVHGEPDFWQNDAGGIDGFEMEVDGEHSCEVSPEALSGIRLQPDPDRPEEL